MKTFELIDKEIDKIVRDRFFCNKLDLSHFSLCLLFSDSKYKKLWGEYWSKFNHNVHTYITGYIRIENSDHYVFYADNRHEIDALTRLMVIEDFKLHCYKVLNK